MDWKSAGSQLRDKIRVVSEESFEELALAVFRYQAEYNPLYRQYIDLLRLKPQKVDRLEQIPFLPIQFFKTHEIKTGEWNPEMWFSSSGTGGFAANSRHAVCSVSWYLDNTVRIFDFFYGKIEEYAVLALLPAYLEREGSSLVLMAEHFIKRSKYPQSGFFLYDQEALIKTLQSCREAKIPVLLLGVSFALWDLAENHPVDLSGAIVMETGGMKGRRKEITRAELHGILCQAFRVKNIHSEYGMTELFSQAYSKGEGLFFPPPAMKVLTREITDPLCPQKYGKNGAINIIDLANIDTISFIATDDLGKVYEDGSFEILGRMDASDIRGCNLLLE